MIVLGMHRSGTSALTRVLSLRGAALPLHPMQGSDMNPRGFFESERVYQLHEEILDSAGSAWNDIAPIPDAWFESGVAANYVELMAEVVREEFVDSPLFTLKDPRICRLVPFWTKVLERVDSEPNFVLTVRNPLEVAASLLASQEVDEQQGLLLWLQHFLLAERDTRAHKRCFTTFEQVLTDWRAVVDRASKELDIVFPRMSHKAAAETDTFLSNSLRHHVAAPQQVAVREDVADWVKTAYDWALRAADGRRTAPSQLDRVATAFFEAARVFGPVVASSEHARERGALTAAELRGSLEEAQTRATELQQSLEELNEKESQLQTRAEVAELDHSQLEQRITSYQHQVSELVECIKVMLVWIASSTAGGNDAAAQLATLLESLDGQEADSIPRTAIAGLARYRESAELAQITQVADDRSRRLEELEAIAAARESELAELRPAVDELDALRRQRDSGASEIETLRTRLAEADAQVGELGHAAQQLADLQHQLAVRDAEIARLEGLQQQRTRAESQWSAREGDLTSQIAELRERLAAAESQLADREAQASRMAEELRERSLELESARVVAIELNETRDRLTALQSESSTLREQLLAANSRNETLEADRLERLRELDRVREEMRAAHGEIQRLHGMLSMLQSGRATS